MLPLHCFLRVPSPITADLVELPDEGRAVASITGEDRAQLACGINYEKRRQIMVHRAAVGAAICGETGLALPTAHPCRTPVIQGFERDRLKGVGQFASVAFDAFLLIGRKRRAENIWRESLHHGAAMRVRRTNGDAFGLNMSLLFQ